LIIARLTWVTFLPFTVALLAGTAAAARLVARIGARPLLIAGFDRAFMVGAGIAAILLVIAIGVIRVRRADLNGG
jgi:hypothetical protein